MPLIDFSLKNRFVVLLADAGLILIVPGGPRPAHRGCRSTPSPTRRRCRCRSTPSRRSSRPRRSSGRSPSRSSRPSAGCQGLEELRSVSKFGLSQVVVIFEDGTDIYFARQLINERLGEVELPEGIERPDDGPGRDRPGRGLPLPRHEREPRVRPDRAPDAPRLGDPPAAAARPGRGRGQHLGRAREAVPGPGRPDEARQVRPDARRPGRGPRGEQPERRRRLRRPRRRVEPRPGRRPRRHRRRDRRDRHQGRSTACRSASATSPRSSSATRSAAAPSPPTARARWCSAWASC